MFFCSFLLQDHANSVKYYFNLRFFHIIFHTGGSKKFTTVYFMFDFNSCKCCRSVGSNPKERWPLPSADFLSSDFEQSCTENSSQTTRQGCKKKKGQHAGDFIHVQSILPPRLVPGRSPSASASPGSPGWDVCGPELS